jgi:flagellar biosynthetic protein FlhB
MPDGDSGEKTEQPTSKRKGEARRKGNVAKSQEVGHAVTLLVSLMVFKIFGTFIMDRIKLYTTNILHNLDQEITILSIQTITINAIKNLAIIISPFLFSMLIAGILASLIQVGWIFTTETLKWKWDFLNIASGFKKIFSKESLKNLVKGIIKIAVLLFICYLTMKKDIFTFMHLVDMDIHQIFHFLSKMVLKLLMNILLIYIVIASVDFIITKYFHMQKMKMSKQEVKDEFKQMEGDPQVRNKMRSLMMEESRKKMMDDVPKADVVITNPIHIAVALKYAPEVSDAPIVVAKGKRLIAQNIKDLAKQHKIPIVEDPPLARLLYKNSIVGKEIPVDLYSAVAEIFAQIFRMKNRKR